jgi:hypothetical protein
MKTIQALRRHLLPPAALVLVLTSVAAACPTCKDALAGVEGQGDIVGGYFYSIMFMVSMPFIILGVFSFCVYRAVKRAKAAGMYDPARYMPQQSADAQELAQA